MDRAETCTAVPTHDKNPHRLYPSLPNTDRYGVYVPSCSTETKLQTAVEFHPEARLEDKQSEVPAAGGHVTMKAQMIIFETQKQELLSINEKWAKEYKTMVQYYKQRVQDLKSLLQQSHGPVEYKVREPEEPLMAFCDNLQFNKDNQRKWSEDTGAVSELLKAEEEAKDLRAQNIALTRRGQHQHDEIIRLNKALETALQTSQPLGCSETLQDLWKHQAEVYKEDFLKERRDRENLKEKYLEMKKRFIKISNELCVCKSQLVGTPPRPLPDCSNRAVRQVNRPNAQLQRRHAGDNRQ